MHLRRQTPAFPAIIALCSAAFVLGVFIGSASGEPAGPDARFYTDYGTILQRHVNESGLVNYRELLREREKLDAFVLRMAALKSSDFDTWKEPDKIAFWINAYNALTLKAILDNYPIQPTFPARLRFPDNSIRQIRGVWDKITFNVMGREITLDTIEHSILRKEFNEPRIHMAIVCASKGCAPLRNEPYSGDKLEIQLREQSLNFLSSPLRLFIDEKKKVVNLSPYFKWFGEDFIKTYGTSAGFSGFNEIERASLNFISGYIPEAQRSYLAKGDYRINYLDYDWSLNEQ